MNQTVKPVPNRGTLSSLLGLATLALLATGTTRAATLQVIVAGYFGNNTLSDSTTLLPVGTVVDFGLFFSGGSFTTSAAISTALGSVTTDAGMQSFRANNGWVSFGSGAVSQVNGDFRLLWDLNETSVGPGFGTEFELNPTITPSSNAPYASQLNGQILVGKIPYLWVQTTGPSVEYGLFVSNQAFSASGFGNFTQVDVNDGGDPAYGVTALFGLLKSDGSGIATQAIPEPSAGACLLLAGGLFALRQRKIKSSKK
jgi:hypothetical protein